MPSWTIRHCGQALGKDMKMSEMQSLLDQVKPGSIIRLIPGLGGEEGGVDIIVPISAFVVDITTTDTVIEMTLSVCKNDNFYKLDEDEQNSLTGDFGVCVFTIEDLNAIPFEVLAESAWDLLRNQINV